MAETPPFLIYFCFAIFLSSSFTLASITKPGCPYKCGNLTIPYPFGLNENCAYRPDFIVPCYANASIIPYHEDDIFVNISATQVILAGGSAVIKICGTQKHGAGAYFMTGSPFSLSATDNRFTVIGCNRYGLIQAVDRLGPRQYRKCISTCAVKSDLYDRTCGGFGCCQVPLPRGLQTSAIELNDASYEESISSGNCSYAFIVQKSSFKFGGAVELKRDGYIDRLYTLPVVYDWFITANSCTSARRDSISYACKENSECIYLLKPLKIRGYRCAYLPGYEGNPYLGCSDVNECAANNSCVHLCANFPGGYHCSCRSGYRGDGRRDGSGCIATHLKMAIILGISIGLGSILLLIVGYWGYVTAIRWKLNQQRAANFKRNGGLLLKQRNSSEHGMTENNLLFMADELDKATDHFNENRILGRGGQGTVYKGMMTDGSLVAIKKHKLGDQSQLEEFINEIVILSTINHRNIVRLLGCCLETDVPLLVYEFVANGALSKYLHHPESDYPITWPMRLQIALDVAGAIYHLHSTSSCPIFHKDIKTDNILLDEKYRAKLSDFGTSRSISVDKSHITTGVKGTFGYLDPEYHRTLQYNEKSDVFSFGVVIIELLTGKKAVYQTESGGWENLASSFKESMKDSAFQDMLAAEVVNEVSKETITAITNLASQCLDPDRTQRPTMREVHLELEAISRHQGTAVSFLRALPAIAEGTSSESADVSFLRTLSAIAEGTSSWESADATDDDNSDEIRPCT